MAPLHLYKIKEAFGKNKASLFKTILLVVLIYVFLTGFATAQQIAIKSPLKHAIQSFTDVNNRLYINQKQSYQFSFWGDITQETETLQQQGKPNSFSFPEGETIIQITAANGQSKTFPVIVDGTAPTSKLTLLNAPRFQQNDQLYVGKNLTLQLEASDASSGVLERYWALNNNAFNPFKSQNSEFSSNKIYTVYYYSVDHVGNVEPVQSYNFEVDITGPKMEYELVGPQNLSVISPTSSISLSSSDNASGTKNIYFWFDDNETTSYSTIISLDNLSDGEHTLYTYAIDQVENVGDTLVYTFFLDRTPPTIQQELLGDVYKQDASIYVSAQSSISLSATDNKSGTSWIKYQINQDPEKNYTQPFRLPNLSGNYSITYYTTDAVENLSDRQSFKVYVDNSKPQTNVKFQGYYSKTTEGYAINTETNIELNATDLESGVHEIRYKIGSSNWKVYDSSLSFSELGPVTIRYQAIDEVKNIEDEQTLTLSVNEVSNFIANAKPEKPNASNSAFMKVEDAIQGPDKKIILWISSSEADTSEKFMMTLSADSSSDFPIALQPNAETSVTIHIEEQKNEYPITIDGAAPKTSLAYTDALSFTKNDQLTFAPGVSLSLAAIDNIAGVKEIYTSENGGRYQLYNKVLRGYYTEQKYIINYYSVDKVGNEEPEQTFTFNVDATPPITTHSFISNFSGSNLSKHTEITLSADDNMSGVKTTHIQLNNNDPILYSGKLTLGDLGSFEEAFNTIYYYSIDNVGNTEQRKQFNFRIDLDGPAATFMWQGKFHTSDQGIYIHPSTKLSLSAQDSQMEIREIMYSVNSNSAFKPYSTPIDFESLKSATIRYVATDELGNKGDEYSIFVTIDSEPPISRHTITGNTLENGSEIVLGKGTSIHIISSDAKSGVTQIQYSINTENLSSYSSPITFTSSGRKIIRFKAEDYVGNIEEVHLISLLYDQSAPQIDLSFSKVPVLQTDAKIVIDSETLISIKSIDSETEVKSLEFKIDEENFSTYFRPLIISKKGIYKLTVKSTDLLENVNEQIINIEVQ